MHACLWDTPIIIFLDIYKLLSLTWYATPMKTIPLLEILSAFSFNLYCIKGKDMEPMISCVTFLKMRVTHLNLFPFIQYTENSERKTLQHTYAIKS